MKIVKQLSSIVNEFIEKNGKLIAGTVVFSVIAAIAKDYGYLSPNYGFGSNGEFKFSMKPDAKKNNDKSDTVNDPRCLAGSQNSLQEAIVSFWRTGISSSAWEITRTNAADSIAKLMESRKEVTESDLMYAVQAMTKIAQMSNWESTKQTINSRIARLVSTITPVKEPEETNDSMQ